MVVRYGCRLTHPTANTPTSMQGWLGDELAEVILVGTAH